MPEWLQGILDWVGTHPQVAGLVIAVVSFLEGFAVIGIIIPGIIILFGFGALVGLGVLELWTVWLWCTVGAIAGDAVSFWLGHHFKNHIADIWPFTRVPDLLDRGKTFFKKHGLKSIVIGRFIGPIRPIMPVVAGMMQMNLKIYIPANVIAGTLWAPAYLLPGVVFGASLEIAKAIAFRLALFMIVLVGTIWLTTWLVKRLSNYLAPRTARMLSFALEWSRRHPWLGRPAQALVDPSRPDSGTLMLFALMILIAAWGLITLMITLPLSGGVLPVDFSIAEAMQSLRTPWADHMMLVFDAFGSLFVLIPLAVFVLAFLLWRKRYLGVTHWLAAIVFGLFLALLFDQVLDVSNVPTLEAAGRTVRPMMHITLSVVVYGYFAVMIARQYPRRTRLWPYGFAAVLVSLIAMARLYFGLHTTSSVVAGIFLGMLWVCIIGIAYRRRMRRPFWNTPLAIVFYSLAVVLAMVYLKAYGDQILNAYRPAPAVIELTRAEWAERIAQDDADSQPHLQFAGTLDALQGSAEQLGWTLMDKADWSTSLAMMQPAATPETLPVLPSLYRNRAESLLMHRWDESDGRQWVLHVWPLNIRLDDGREVWRVAIMPHELVSVAVLFNYWQQLPVDEQSERWLDELRSARTAVPGASGHLLME